MPSHNRYQQQAFTAFYDAYAPKLWGLIQVANLPAAQSEKILASTLINAWRHPDQHKCLEEGSICWLIGLAHAAGLPVTTLKFVFKKNG